MRRIGTVLLWAGVVVGVASAAWLWIGPAAGGMPLLLGIGLIKLTFVAGLALIGAGGVGLRLANRADHQRRLEGIDPDVTITADRKAGRVERGVRK